MLLFARKKVHRLSKADRAVGSKINTYHPGRRSANSWQLTTVNWGKCTESKMSDSTILVSVSLISMHQPGRQPDCTCFIKFWLCNYCVTKTKTWTAVWIFFFTDSTISVFLINLEQSPQLHTGGPFIASLMRSCDTSWLADSQSHPGPRRSLPPH